MIARGLVDIDITSGGDNRGESDNVFRGVNGQLKARERDTCESRKRLRSRGSDYDSLVVLMEAAGVNCSGVRSFPRTRSAISLRLATSFSHRQCARGPVARPALEIYMLNWVIPGENRLR